MVAKKKTDSLFFIIFFFILFCLFTSPPDAYALKENLVLLPLQGEGLTQMDMALLQSALKQGLSKKYNTYSGSQVIEKLKKYQIVECNAKECLSKIALDFNGSLVARGFIIKNDSSYTYSVEIKDVLTDKDVFSKTEGCASCSRIDLLTKIKGILSKSKEKKDVIIPRDANGVEIVRITPKITGDVNSKKSSFKLNTNPDGAEVFIDKIKSGKTPFINDEFLPGQKLRIKVEKDKYHPKIVEFKLERGVNDLGTVKLKPNFGGVSITSEPSGANVYLDRKLVGKTPFKTDSLKSKLYALSIRHPLCKFENEKRILVEDGKNTERHFKLIPDFGTLIIKEPEGTDVSIVDEKENKIVKLTTPVKKDLKIGRYKLILQKKGYDKRELNTEILFYEKTTVSPKESKLEESYNRHGVYVSYDYLPFKLSGDTDLKVGLYGIGYKYYDRNLGNIRAELLTGQVKDNFTYTTSNGTAYSQTSGGTATVFRSGYSYPVLDKVKGFNIEAGVGAELLLLSFDASDKKFEVDKYSSFIDFGTNYISDNMYVEFKLRYVIGDSDDLEYIYGTTINFAYTF